MTTFVIYVNVFLERHILCLNQTKTHRTMVAKARKPKGKRYSDEERANVLAFVEKTNADKGRGGITAASKKFGVTPLTISNWLKGGGSRASGEGSHIPETLRRMADLHEEIAKAQEKLDGLQKEYAELKRKL